MTDGAVSTFSKVKFIGSQNRLTDYSLQEMTTGSQNHPRCSRLPFWPAGFITAPPVIENLLIYFPQNGSFGDSVTSVLVTVRPNTKYMPPNTN